GIDKNSNGQVFFFPLAGSSDSMIIACENTISLYNNQKNIVYYKNSFSEIQKSPFIKYYKLNDGSIYCIIDNNAYIFDASEKTVEVVSNIHPQSAFGQIINMFIDANGIQWFGSNGSGILKRDPQKKRFKSYKFPHPNSAIISLTLPLKNPFLERLQMLGGFGNLILDNDGIYRAILKKSKSKLNPVTLYAHDPKSNSTTQLADIPFTHIYPFIYNDSKNRIWLYYHDSLKKNYIAQFNKVNNAVVAAYEIPETIESPEPYISQFYLDNKGIMWLATINGLYAFDEKNKAWKHWKNKPKNIKSISADGVLSICPDPMEPEKYLWIGTEGGGINRFEKATGDCIRYDENNGLPNDVTYCILSDSLNNLWISTNKGLSCFNPLEKKFINYTSDDGLPSDEFNRYTAMYMRNEELMFGGVNGYVIFNPKEVLKRQPAAPLVFTSISVLNKTINWPNNHKNVDAPVGYCKKLTLLPGQNIFSISFATLEYRNNQKKMYKYRLDGFDDDWSVPSSKNEVTYTNLNPGHYTFYVKGANTDGVWNDDAIRLSIVVQPFWYQTLMFKFLSLSFLVYLLYVFYRYRLKQGLKIEKLRNRIARDLHDEIGSTLSSISIYAAAAKKVSAGNEKAVNILSKINTGTSEMMEAMSDIVWAVNTGSGHFYDLVNRVRSFAVQVTEAKNIELHFTDNNDLPEISLNMEQRKNIYLICKEAVSNAAKYSGCTLLEVLIRTENRKLHILIRDNGVGFDSSRFESDPTGHSLGGNGIKNMRHRAAEIDAKLTLYSNLGDGTSIELIAPCKIS
nr:hypothetical protein [Saprospiraceae bacterium]